MDSARAVLISDVHIDQWEADLGGLGPAAEKRRAFLEFLEWVGGESHAKRLVILGDLVDVPPRRGSLLPEYSDVARKLKELVDRGVELHYVVGNHDSGILGLQVAMSAPVIHVDYPCRRLESGGKTFLLEHGHLYDPCLIEYVRYHAALMLRRDSADPGPPLVPKTGEGSVREPKAVLPPEFATGLLGLWQVDRAQDGTDAAHATALVAAVETLLRESEEDPDPELVGVADVTDSIAAVKGALPDLSAAALRAGPPGLPSWSDVRDAAEALVRFVYSGPHWKRVAKRRVRDLETDPATRVDGVIMGHTHYPGTMAWQESGRQCQYVNSGSWRNDAADMVLIESGELILYERLWTDPPPSLPA